MQDNQPQPVNCDGNNASRPTAERLPIGTVSATIALTALVYTTQTASFLHLKLFVLACGLALLGLATILIKPRHTARMSLAVACAGFFAYSGSDILGGRVIAHEFQSGGDAVFLTLVVYLLPLFTALALGALSREENRRRISTTIIAVATAASVLAIGQYTGVLIYFFPAYPGASPIYSVFGNSGLLGGYLAIALPLALAAYVRSDRVQPLHLMTLSTLAAALLLSGARTAWLAAAIGSAISIRLRADRRRTAIALAVLAGVVIGCAALAPAQTVSRFTATLSGPDTGAELRWWFWAGTWRMIAAHPVAGVGIGRYAMESPLYLADVLWSPGGETFAHNTLLTGHPHNDILLVLAETGIIGLFFLIWLGVRLYRCRGFEWGAVAALFVFALFNSPLHSPPHALAGLLLIACMVQRTASEQREKPSLGNWTGRTFGFVALVAPPLVWYAILVPSYRLQQAQTAHVTGRPALAKYSDAAANSGFLGAEIDEKYAIALLDAGDDRHARDRFEEALRGGDSGSIYLGLGTAEYLLNDKRAAFNALKKAVYRWPSHVDCWRLLMRVCPEEERPEWLNKAKRFLTAGEVERIQNEQ